MVRKAVFASRLGTLTAVSGASTTVAPSSVASSGVIDELSTRLVCDRTGWRRRAAIGSVPVESSHMPRRIGPEHNVIVADLGEPLMAEWRDPVLPGRGQDPALVPALFLNLSRHFVPAFVPALVPCGALGRD